MAQMSNYLENKLVRHVLRGELYEPPETVYIALFLTDPSDADIGTEVSGHGYQRMPVYFTEPVDGMSANENEVVFPIALGPWGTITHVGLYDDVEGGNLLFHGELTLAKEIDTDDEFKFRPSMLSIQLA